MVRSAQSLRRGPIDFPLLVVTGVLVLFGVVVLTSVSAPLAQEQFGNPWGFVVRQLALGVGVGCLLFFVASNLRYALWRPLALPILLGSIFLLFIVFIPQFGLEAGGATRWIVLGPVTIQPGEFAKFAIVLYLAAWLSGRRVAGGAFQESLLPFMAIVGTVGLLLIMQPDVSTLGVIAITSWLIYFAAGTPIAHTGMLFASGVGLLLLLIRVAPYRANRILAFLNPAHDPQGISYQINQAILAIGSGGLLGHGLGFSRQKFFYLPEAMGDSIFAIAAEELGFVGAMALVSLFVLFAFRGFSIARRAPDDFGRILALGLTSWIVIQAFLNIAGNLGLAPLVGITLPFVSYGSSSLAVTLLSAGVLLNISRYTKARKPFHTEQHR